ncbi:MAG: hypothetical protein NXY57DRAFT_1041063 [Lentinula lateritia]|nr:MAG: hypothetical protein NXY57DRAFT_1041063 [Lentinula lateritia]
MGAFLRRSSRQAMKALLKRFPTLEELKLDPREVDVWALREFQLEQLGILRKISPFPGLQNVDPDFEILQRMFESTSSMQEGDDGLAPIASSSQSQPGNVQELECFLSDLSEVEEDSGKSERPVLATDASSDLLPLYVSTLMYCMLCECLLDAQILFIQHKDCEMSSFS